MMRPKVSVITPVDDCSNLSRLLQSLEDQTLPSDCFDLILATHDFAKVNRHISQFDLGFAYAIVQISPDDSVDHSAGIMRNAAVARSRADVLVFVDSDMLLHPHALSEHLAILGGGDRIASCGLANELPFPEQRQLEVGYFPDFEQVCQNVVADYRLHFLDVSTDEAACEWDSFYTCNAAVSREAFLAVGGFDESGFRCHDMDLAYRLSQVGVKFMFAPSARAVHLEHPRSARHRLSQAAGLEHLADKHPEIGRIARQRARWARESFEKEMAAASRLFDLLTETLDGYRLANTFVALGHSDLSDVEEALAPISFLKTELNCGVRFTCRMSRNCWDFEIILPLATANPAVTIGLPYAGELSTVGRTLESILRQTMQDFEIIFVIDGVNDPIEKAMAPAMIDKRIRMIRLEENVGQSCALNEALQRASAAYLLHIDSDDWLEPSVLETLFSELEASPNAVAAYGAARLHFPDGRTEISRPAKGSSKGPPIQATAVQAPRIYRTEVLKSIGGWSTNDLFEGRFFEDRRTLQRISEQGDLIESPQAVVNVSVRPGSLSRSNPLTAAAAKLGILWEHARVTSKSLEYRIPGQQLIAEFKEEASNPLASDWSVVIPFDGDWDLLRISLNSWREVYDQQNVEIIVVSQQGDLLEKLPSLPDNQRVIFAPEDSCPGACRNKGVSEATGSYIYFSDSDHIVKPSTLRLHEETHQRIDRRSIVIGNVFGTKTFSKVTSGLSPAQKRKLLSLAKFSPDFEAFAGKIAVGKEFGTHEKIQDSFWLNYQDIAFHEPWMKNWAKILLLFGNELRGYPHKWARVSSGAMSISKECFSSLGGFDEEFRSMEDWEFGARAVQSGLGVICLPEAEPLHQVHERHPKRIDRDTASARQFASKHSREFRLLTWWKEPNPPPAARTLTHALGGLGSDDQISQAPQVARQFALTFDDGPFGTSTSSLLEDLRQHNLVATFFLSGHLFQKMPHMAEEICGDGHEIGIHGWHHENLKDTDAGLRYEQLSYFKEQIFKTTGCMPRWYRPPYGKIDQVDRAISEGQSLMIAGWNLSTRDWVQSTVETQIMEVAAQGLGGKVVLAHEGVDSRGKQSSFLAWLGKTSESYAVEARTLSSFAEHNTVPTLHG